MDGKDKTVALIYNMKSFLLVVAAALIAVAAANTSTWTEIRVKYGPTWIGTDLIHFWKIQNTLTQALLNGWQLVNINNNLNLRAVAIASNDFGVNPLYDARGYLAGIHVAVLASRITTTGPQLINPVSSGTNEIKTIGGQLHFASTFLLVDPAVLASGGRPTLGPTVGQGLWLRDTTAPNGYRQIPTDLSRVLAETPYTWQNCIPNMGIHYFYNMSESMNCADFYSWFLIGQNGVVHGLGYQLFGQTNVVARDWYDFIIRISVQATVPKGPECLYDLTSDYGVISIHFYFIPNPWNISCNQATDSVSPIWFL